MSNAPYSPSPYSPTPGAPAPAAPPPNEAVFAPLPLRSRGVLENLDLAFKLFKQYWKPLLAWGAITNGMMLLALATSLSFLVGPPLMIGPVCCVLAAAVRGQNVTFKQCWGFSQPRVGNLLAMHLLSSLISGAIVGALCIGLFIFSAWLNSALPSASFWPAFVFIVLIILIGSLVLSAGLAWQGMVSMVTCMEEENRSVGALKRAWILLRGRWKAALSLLTILNLALLALWGVLYGIFGLLAGVGALGNAFSGRGDDSAIVAVLGALVISSWLVFTLFMPIYYLAQALFYLDARVRHEALDLEWNAHRTTESAPNSAVLQPQAYANAPQTFFQTVDAPGAPQASPGTWSPPPQAPVDAVPFSSPSDSAIAPTTSTWEPPQAPSQAPFSPATFSSPSDSAIAPTASTWEPPQAPANTGPFAPADFSGTPASTSSAPSPFAAPPETAPAPFVFEAPAPANVSLQKPKPEASGAAQAEDETSTWGGNSPFSPR